MKRLFVHSIVIVALLASWLPVANIFWRAKMPIGYDTSNFAHYVQNFREHPAFPVAAWKASEFGGMSRLVDSTWLHFYLIQPLVSLIGFFPAVKLYPLLFAAGYLVFSYLLFFEISGNMLLAAGLAFLVSRSGVTYVALYSSGVVLSFLSQTFYPMMLYFLVRFGRREEWKSLTAAAVALALGMYTHPGTTTTMTLVSAFLFLMFFQSRTVKMFDVWKKLKIAVVFFTTTTLIGALALGPDAVAKYVDGGHQWLRSNVVPEIKAFTFLFSTLNPWMWPVVSIAVVIGVLFIRQMNRFVLSFAAMVFYFFIFQWSLWLGKNPLGGFMFPHRVYFMILVSGLGLVAALAAPRTMAHVSKGWQWIWRGITVVFLPILLLTSGLWPLRQMFVYLDDSWFTGGDFPYKATDPKRDYGQYFWDMSGADPSFFAGIDNTYRFYALDYSHNITAGMATDLPQAKGVFAYSDRRNVDWFAWMDGVFEEETQLLHRIDPYVAEQQSRFLIDWFGIRTLFSVPKIPEQLARWITSEPRPYIEDRKTQNGVVLAKVTVDATSPIVVATNAKVIGFVGSKQGYDSFLRNLGVLNANSQYLIPVQLAEHTEDLTEQDLTGIDGLFIYSYFQKQKDAHAASWERISAFVKNGGIVVVDTGAGAPEKYMDRLPDIFPMDRIQSGSVGKTWEISTKDPLFATVNFDKLSPLTYEGGDWTMDYATSLRPDAKADLTIGGNMVVAQRSLGRGRFVWSGINMPYRMHYFAKNAQAEIRLIGVLMEGIFGVAKTPAVSAVVTRPASENLTVTTQGAHGILFKENNYGGWVAKAQANGKTVRLPIRSAGVDFMYVRLPEALGTGPVTVTWRYWGRWENWVFFALTVISLFCVIEGFMFDYRWTGQWTGIIHYKLKLVRARFRRWWEKEGN